MDLPAPALTVPLGDRSYPIYIGEGLLHNAALLAALLPARQVAVVTNDIVGPLYAPRLQAARAAAVGTAAVPLLEIVLPDGERHKTLPTVSRILDTLVANRFARDDLVVALGGGVVGDMTGFAAACYQRGVGFLQVPTTLLAQVDSSVGGKTGVNHPGGKNLIGAFHQPLAVLADTATLVTLPPRELRAGLAEVVNAHRRTFHVPTWESHAPRGVPHELSASVSGDFPQSPVSVKTLAPAGFWVFFDSKTRAWPQGVELVAADRPEPAGRDLAGLRHRVA